MAQDLVSKRLNIAAATVTQATALWNATIALRELQAERAVAGNFEDTDFDGTDLQHLTAFMIGAFLDTHVPALVDAIDDHQQQLLELRK